AGAQSISFAAISDKNVGDQFTVTPTASSGLDLVVTVVSGPATVVASGLTGFNPSQRIFTVTTTGPGVVKLQATQAGSAAPLVVANMMQQSFNVLGLPSITSGGTAAATVGVPFTFNITATGDPIIAYTAIGLPASLTLNSTTGAITGTPIAAGIINVTDITARNATGTSSATTLTITVGAAGAAPIITSDTSTAGTIDKSFNFSIVASGSPTSYTASPLPAGVLFNTITGVFSGKPTTEGVTSVALSATNAGGTDTATLTITVGAAGIPPIITSGITAPGTVGTTFGPYQIVATGLPTSYSAAGLPAGLIVNVLTGRISGTPTTAGVSVATINATNLGGTGSATLTITVAAVGVAPIITSATTTSGDVGTVFLTYQIVATGLPTSFSATGLPAGLTVNALTGAINGTPTTEGVSIATIKATNSAGTGTASLRITVAAASSSPIITSANTAAGTVGTPFVTYQILATGNPTSYGAGNLPAGLVVNTLTGRITGTPVSTGNYRVFVRATTSVGVASETVAFAIAPAISVQPASTSVASGAGTTFSVEADSGGNPKTYQWQKHGVDLPGATGTTLTIANVKSEDVGTYRVVVSSWGTSTTSVPALLGMTFTGQIAGSATMVGADIVHPNGNIYDQVLLTGSAASVKADPGQIVRISFVDLTDDIVQLELGGAGTLTINLANSSGPAAPVNYEQPGVLYMKGHASISIRDADATTNVSVFSVGRSNAVDQGLFREGVAYDGYADISLLNIGSTDGFFGGARTANASYFGSSGMTGIFAAGVQFSGPVYVQDINGANNANAVLMLGLAGDVRITGGNLLQDNGGSIEVSGITRLQFTDGTSSGGALLPAQVNRGVLMTNGVDVTGRLVP
ncbi:MAG: putative Ig domain-containing protein, partial [Opitutus sp.]